MGAEPIRIGTSSVRGLLRRNDRTEDESAFLKADALDTLDCACNRERDKTYTVQVNPQDKVGFCIISVLQILFPDK